MSRQSIIKIAISALLCSLMTGCGGKNSKIKEVKTQIDEIQKKTIYPIEPLPTFPEMQLHRYSAEQLTNPFDEPKTVVRTNIGQPDQLRAKEELESYPLDSLKMVGTLHKGSQVWALVIAPNGTIYRVTLGNHLGKNYGRITDIKKDGLDLIETVPDGLGNWKKREVTLNLFQGKK